MSSCLGQRLGAEVEDNSKGYLGTLAGNGKVFYLGCGKGYTGRSPIYTFVKTHSTVYLK